MPFFIFEEASTNSLILSASIEKSDRLLLTSFSADLNSAEPWVKSLDLLFAYANINMYQ